MRSLTLIALSLLISISGRSQTERKQERSFTIYSCESAMTLRFTNDQVELRDVAFTEDSLWHSKTLDSSIVANFNALFDRFAELPQKVVYHNSCIDDGFNFKIYVQVGSEIQKIFVGNYYNKLVDDLTRLFDQNLADFHSGYRHTIGYGSSPGYIARLIASQEACTEKPDEQLIDDWCEMPK